MGDGVRADVVCFADHEDVPWRASRCCGATQLVAIFTRDGSLLARF